MMMPAFAIGRIVAVFLAVAYAATASVDDASAKRRKDRPGEFDFYLMAFSIAPSFCMLTGDAAGKQQCADASDDAYQANPLTVHGLWPNRKKVSVNLQPQSCSTAERAEFSPDLQGKLEIYMPGIADDLQEHEWSKHGVCSGMSSDEYFRTIVRIAEVANATIGAAIKENGFLGQRMRIRDLLGAVAEKNARLADAIVVDCKMPRRQRGSRNSNRQEEAMVSEIRVMISKDLSSDPDGDGWPGSFVPLNELGFGANSGCPGGAGLLPDGYGR